MGGGGNNPEFWGEMIKPLLIAGAFIFAAVCLGVLLQVLA